MNSVHRNVRSSGFRNWLQPGLLCLLLLMMPSLGWAQDDDEKQGPRSDYASQYVFVIAMAGLGIFALTKSSQRKQPELTMEELEKLNA